VCVCACVCFYLSIYAHTHICSSGTRDGTRAAGMESAIGQQFDSGTKFTVTVTVGGKVVRRVPFVNKGDQGSQMSQSFWTVSPL
jgi:hypothetical protein